MNNKYYFENPYENYSTDADILNEMKDSISNKFKEKLENFKSKKLLYLINNMKKDIFYDRTVYTGSAGTALLYLNYSLHTNEDNPGMLQKALEYIDVSKLKAQRISFLCGDAGPLAIAAVISFKLGAERPDRLPDYKQLADRLISLISLLDQSPDEILYGKSGYLYSLLFVNKYTNDNVIPASHIQKVVKAILKSGKQFAIEIKSESPLMWQWHEKCYLGAAHGVAGILYMLLQARSYLEADDIRVLIKPTLDWVLDLQFPSGNFPSSLESKSGDRLVQWCHGAPGFVPLCVLAYKVFNEMKYINVAAQCGDLIWQRGLCTKGYSICHGVSGNAYAFLELYQTTKNPLHLHRACCFTQWCVDERTGTQQHSPERPASLFEGLVGRLYLANDIARPLDAKFPAMCL